MPSRLLPASFEQQVKAGVLAPVYLLTGPDDDLKRSLLRTLTETLEEDLRPFNLDRLHAADSKSEARKQLWLVLDLAKTLPMMAPRRLVFVLSAEKLMGALRENEGGGAELEAFERYLKAPEPHATIVLVSGGELDKRMKASQLLSKLAVVVQCDPLAESGDAAGWIRAEAGREGIRIEPAASRLLARLAGGDITRLRAEFERAVLFASGDGIITEMAVQEIASAPTTRDAWAMTNAMERQAAGEALRELGLKLDAGEAPVMILGQLAWFVRMKMPPAGVAAAVDAVFRTDLALKTSRGDPRVLLERLVVELCG